MANIVGTTLGDTVTVNASGGTLASNVTITAIASTPSVTLTSGQQVNSISLGDGNDLISIVNASVIATRINGNIDMGAGDDSVVLNHSSVRAAVSLGESNDGLTLTAGSTISSLVDFNDGNSTLVMTGGSNITGAVSLGDGAHSIHMSGSTISSSLSAATYGTDGNTLNTYTLDMSGGSSIANGIAFANLDGGGQISVNASTISGVINLGDGADGITLTNSSRITSNMSLGDGDSTVVINSSTVAASIHFGDGAQSLTAVSASLGGIGGAQATDNQAGNTYTIELTNSTVGQIYLDALDGGGNISLTGSRVSGSLQLGDGADSIVINGSSVGGHINLGDGNSTIAITNSTLEAIRLGDGVHSINVANSTLTTIGDNYATNNQAGNDCTIELTNSTIAQISLAAMDGDGSISAVGSSITVGITTGDGDDTLNFQSVTVSDGVNVSDGNNSIVFDHVSMPVNNAILVGDGSHTINISNSTIYAIASNANDAAIDDQYHITISDSHIYGITLQNFNLGGTIVYDNATLVGSHHYGTGSDYVNFGNSSLGNGSALHMGAGNDTLVIGKEANINSLVDCGLGGADMLVLQDGAMIRNNASGPTYTVGVTPISVINAGLSGIAPWSVTLASRTITLSNNNTMVAVGDSFIASNFEQIGLMPCFSAGTKISTSNGDIEVQDLRCGDLVHTLDHRLQEIRWIGRRTLIAIDLQRYPELRPIRIGTGALGGGLPERELIVSPQHRMMVRNRIANTMFGQMEVLVPAKHLLALDGIEVAADIEEVTYVHFMCSQHEVVLAEGAPTETLYIGKGSVGTLSREALDEIFEIFPTLRLGLQMKLYPPPARHIVSPRDGRRFAGRISRRSESLLEYAKA